MSDHVRDQVIAGANNVPQLIAAAKVADPQLFAALNGMPVWRLYGPATTAIVAWVAGRYGIGWDAGTCSGIALFLVTAGAGIVHRFKPTPVAKLTLLGGLLAFSLSACATTATTTAAVGTAIVAGQLFCDAQPAIVRVIDWQGQGVSVIGKTAHEVEAICAIVGGVPVPPPPSPEQAPVNSTVL